MKKTSNGYVCAYGYLEKLLKEIEQFCDSKLTSENKDGFIVTP